MRVVLLILLLAPTLQALDITTLDGKIYRECRVARVYPDSICVLFSGGGARISFTNLPEAFRAQYGYDPQRAVAFQSAEADRAERQRAQFHLQRQQLQSQARARAAAAQPAASQSPPNGGANFGSEYVGVRLTTAAGRGNNQNNNRGAGGFGRTTGATYVGVRMAAPGGIYGVTVSGPPVRAAAAAAATFNNP